MFKVNNCNFSNFVSKNLLSIWICIICLLSNCLVRKKSALTWTAVRSRDMALSPPERKLCVLQYFASTSTLTNASFTSRVTFIKVHRGGCRPDKGLTDKRNVFEWRELLLVSTMLRDTFVSVFLGQCLQLCTILTMVFRLSPGSSAQVVALTKS